MQWEISRPKKMRKLMDGSLFEDLACEISTGNDDPAQIDAILRRHGFYHLPEYEKLRNLCIMRRYGSIGVPRFEDSMPIIARVLKGDNIRILHALLPLIPTYAVAEESISLEYTWIGDHQSNQNILYTTASRWSREKCACINHVHATKQEQLCARKKLASDILAAELFRMCLSFLDLPNTRFPTRCGLYLLAVCPQLLAIPIYNHNAVADILTVSVLGDALLDKPILQYIGEQHIEDFMGIVRSTAGNGPEAHEDYMKVLLADARTLFKTHILQPESFGRLLVHYYCQMPDMWYSEKIGCLVESVQQLGVSPAAVNSDGMTALDVLVRQFCRHDWNLRGDESEWGEQITRFINIASAILPYFKDNQIALPQLVQCRSRDDCKRAIQQVWEVIVDVALFPKYTAGNLASILHDGLIRIDDMSSCVSCEPLTLLVHREMCKGLDVTRHRCAISPYATARTGRHTILGWLVRRLGKRDKFWMPYGNPNFVSPLCCQWLMLELIINSSPRSLGKFSNKILNMLGKEKRTGEFVPLPLSIGSRAIRMLWRYDPKSKPGIAEFLQKLALCTDPEAQKTAAELESTVNTVPSLQSLTRVCILRNIRYKDIVQLPLPDIIKRYLQIGEISSDHPVSRM